VKGYERRFHGRLIHVRGYERKSHDKLTPHDRAVDRRNARKAARSRRRR